MTEWCTATIKSSSDILYTPSPPSLLTWIKSLMFSFYKNLTPSPIFLSYITHWWDFIWKKKMASVYPHVNVQNNNICSNNNNTSNSYDMENSLKLESMPTLCRSVTLPAETTISKWRVTATIRQLLQLSIGETSAFRGLRAITSLRPRNNFRDTPVFRSHQLPLYENECLE